MKSLSQSEILGVLVKLHSVDSQKYEALKARLQHFQRKGFPSGTNTGRGRPAAYDIRELVLIVMAFELLAIGMTPEQAIATTMEGFRWDQISRYLAELGGRLEEGLENGSEGMRRVLMGPTLLVFQPDGLRALRSDDDQTSVQAAILLDVRDDELEEILYAGPRQAAINLTRVFLSVAKQLEEGVGISASEFGAALQRWAYR